MANEHTCYVTVAECTHLMQANSERQELHEKTLEILQVQVAIFQKIGWYILTSLIVGFGGVIAVLITLGVKS